MAINYTVLKSSIINSSIWNEDAETCKVWITMLAMRNKDGEIFASIGGLAHQSRISVEKTKVVVGRFLEGELDSSSRDDGRRIVEIGGGWRLVNHEKVKAEAAAANKAAYMRTYMSKKRALEKPVSAAYLERERRYEVAESNGDQAKADEIAAEKLPGLGESSS